MDAPKAKKIKKELSIHNDTRIDEYYWLRERENKKVIEYLEKENSYTDSIMKPTEALQEELFQEIIGRIKQQDESVPYQMDGYFYYTRYEEGKEYAIYCRKKENLENPEEIMLDVNLLAKNYDYCDVRGVTISPDKMMISFGMDTVGRRKYTLCFKDLKNGELHKDKILSTTGNAVWANDNKSIFYVLEDQETLRPHKIYKHILGEDGEDKEIYHEKDDTFHTYVYKTKSKAYIIIGSESTLSSEFRYISADKPETEFKIIQKREKDLEYSVYHYEDYFYIITNKNAQNFKLVKTPVQKTEKEHWVDVIPHRKDVFLEGLEIFATHFVLEERKNGLTELQVVKWDDMTSHYIAFNDPTYMAYVSINHDFHSKLIRFGYTSLTTPSSTYDYHMETKERKLLKQQEIVGDFSSENYISERLFALAEDGTQIPISLVYRKNWTKTKPAPLLIEGYGSYGLSSDPYFSSARLSLLDRGFIYAIAHIRGGQEMGRYWYEDGKLLKKKNTFSDFIACSEHLIKEKYTTSDMLFANGGSAGGLLMGAVLNMRPEIYKAVIADVPFVDVVTTMLDDSIPLTTGEYDEWGNPNEKVYYDYMLSYSPYDNVEAKEYPAILVTTGLHDSQVQYWEPAKWVAKFRDMKTDNNVLILKTDMGAGHSGTTGRFKRHKLTAFTYAFILKELGKV